jgi:hypothetical protein
MVVGSGVGVDQGVWVGSRVGVVLGAGERVGTGMGVSDGCTETVDAGREDVQATRRKQITRRRDCFIIFKMGNGIFSSLWLF